MLKKITEKLDSGFRRNDVSGWQVRWTRKKSHQSFLALDQLECRRRVDTESCMITIYVKNPSGLMGLSNFKITPATIPNLEIELDKAIYAASLVNNQSFELPENPKNLPQVQLIDPQVNEKVLPELEERIRQSTAEHKRNDIRLSYAEFFADLIETRLLNHKGLDVEQQESSLHTEFDLLSKSNDKENEFINRYTRRFLKDFDIHGEVTQSALLAKLATESKLPETGQFPVLLSDEALDQLFNPLVARASARLKYNKMISSELGESVLDPGEIKGDKISLWSNGLLDRAVGSNLFDTYGTPSNRTCLIKENILVQRLADKRYADYLAIPVTGELGNIEVEPGATPFDSLRQSARYHICAFSAFEPNAITGNFSAEIRAGYEIVPGKEPHPVKGGSVSGVLQRDLLDCRLSKERVQRERILSPQGILFANLTIAGS